MTDANARAENRKRWEGRSEVWRRFTAGAPPKPDAATLAVMAAVGATPGMRILDMASGTGDPSIPLAERVAPDGIVVATDQSAEMLLGARARAETAAASPLFAVCGMEELPFADACFDGATCRFGIMFPPDRVAAAREARRVLRPGARIAYVVWGPLANNARFATIRAVLLEFSGGTVGADDPQRHALGAPGTLGAILDAAGFSNVEERDLREQNEVPASPPPWRRAIAGENAAWVETLDASGRAALEERMTDAFAPYRAGDGWRLPSHIRLGVATTP